MTNGLRLFFGGMLLTGCSTPPPPPPLLSALTQPRGPAIAGPAEMRVREAIGRVDAIDPRLNSVVALDPTALDQARNADLGTLTGPLAGRPILIKDNIETAGPLPTTAGSLALTDNLTNRDAPLVARLRAAGMIIIGKANLSEWANIRSNDSISGWSAVGGQTRNPYVLNRNPCGSSSGIGRRGCRRHRRLCRLAPKPTARSAAQHRSMASSG